MPSNSNKLIGITMGCPVGIGPEVILKFLQQNLDGLGFMPIVFGFPAVFKRAAAELGLDLELISWSPGSPVLAPHRPGRVYICQPASITLDDTRLTWGKPTSETGAAMAACISACFQLVKSGDLAAMVTAPISKHALKLAGYSYPGHTEMLAQLSGSNEFAMMMAGARLRVTLVTIHVGLAEVAGLISSSKIVKLINITGDSLKGDFGIKIPRIAVAAINPHAGEGGMFGHEEEDIILPAIKSAKAQGWDVEGPFPPDTVFNKAYAGEFDTVICMYHDQGLIPFKLLHFEDGVNVTIGLPIIRTSVDHGTAYDIAGKGLANPLSMQAAFETAAEIANNRGMADN